MILKSYFDHNEKLVKKAKKLLAEFQEKRYHSDRLMSAIGTAQFGKSPLKWKCNTRASSKAQVPSLFIPPLVLKPAILELPVELFKTVQAIVHDGFEETKSGEQSKKALAPAKVDGVVEIAPDPIDSSNIVYSHSDIASQIMVAAKSGKPPAAAPSAPAPLSCTKSFYETYLAPKAT